MSRIAYVNGKYVRGEDARVSIEDRGYQFADAIYEVCLLIDGVFWDMDGHLARMHRSLEELQITAPMSDASLKVVMHRVASRNRLKDALVYLQISRGAAPRNHAFPKLTVEPSLVVTARPFNIHQNDDTAAAGVEVVTRPDIRWGRVDIKTVGLLPNALAKQAAVEAGCGEAWLVRDGHVTEGTSSNAWIVRDDGVILTHPKTNEILGGITRETTLKCAADLQIRVCEQKFTVDQAKTASEAFITSATSLVMPVTKIDSVTIGDGKPGPVALRLRDAYKRRALAQAG